ncbi:MAG: TonB-dependent receptor [Vicinamibacteraceae bacterium]|nr:TonB-dependent receptor [Vicinamibacteraceae bacterium]
MAGLSRFTGRLTFWLLLAALMLPATATAQLTRGAISGTVRDTSGAVVPGVTVTVTNIATNATQSAVTDGRGFYRVAALEPGTYDVVVELSGFTTVQQKAIELNAASEVTIDVELRPAGVGEAVTVTAENVSVTLNKTNATVGATVNQKQITELPLAGGRNINNLILTAPNVNSSVGQGTYAVNGQRPRNNNYMIDGSDNNDISVTIATSQIVPEAVAEFQVLTNPYSVEFGRNSGGQINVITRSGTNRFQGDAWDYYTSSEFYSLTNVEKAAGRDEPARFNRHQAGFDLGGPVLRDKLFFFGLYQWDGQRPGPSPGATVRIPTPAGYAALQNVPLRSGQSAASRSAVLAKLNFLQDIYGQGLTFRNFLNTTVNGVPIETAQTNVTITQPSTYKSYLARGDFRATNSDTFTLRYSFNDREDIDQISNCAFGPLFCGSQALKDTNMAASYTRILSSNMINEFRFSWVRRDLDFPENDPLSPTGTISGLFTVGGATNFPQYRITDTFQYSDMFTWTLSRHTLKLGADIRYNKVDNGSAFNSKGSFTFNNLEAFMNNVAATYTQALQVASFQTDQWQNSFYIQDDFRITPDLTINAGLRYELSTVPLGMFGATDAESLGALVPGPVGRDTNNWAPRVGFAWSPRSTNRLLGDGQTVFRGGFGMGYDVLFYNLLTVNASNYPRIATLTQANVTDLYPNIVSGGATPVFNALNTWVNSAEDTENPSSRFYSLSMQRELGDFLIEIGYTGSKSYKGINQVEMNPAILTEAQAATVRATGSATSIPGFQARRLFPQFGSRITIPAYEGPGGNDVEARSSYNAGYVSVNKRLSRGLQFGGSYTYSRWWSNNDASLGEAGTDAASQRAQDMFNYEAEWSRSVYDRPHRLVVNYLWEIPGPSDGILNAILGGWQISGVTSGQSGRPFTVITGVDTSGDGSSGGDRPNVDPSGSLTWADDNRSFTNNGYFVVPRGANGLPLQNSLGPGNAPRNGFRGMPLWNTDLSLMKRFNVGYGRLMFRIDVFNALNQDNTSIPQNNMNSLTFGQPNTGSYGRRSAQVSVKYSF